MQKAGFAIHSLYGVTGDPATAIRMPHRSLFPLFISIRFHRRESIRRTTYFWLRIGWIWGDLSLYYYYKTKLLLISQEEILEKTFFSSFFVVLPE